MPSPTCSQLKTDLAELQTLQHAFTEALDHARTTGDMAHAQAIKIEIERKMTELKEKLWPFRELPQQELIRQYDNAIQGYRELGFLETLSRGQEGIKDSQGNEYPIPSLAEIITRLKRQKDVFMEKIASFEHPRLHLTPFALPPKTMAVRYGTQIEEHFVERTREGDRRIPDATKTKLFGRDGKPLELRTDKRNIYFSDDCNTLSYFPQWKEKKGAVTAHHGLTKKQAITAIGGWSIMLIEDISAAPSKGEGKTIKDRKQVEGGLNAREQYELLTQQHEEGLTPEEYLSYAMLYLKENNRVADDDLGTSYYCRLLGAAIVSGVVPNACWNRVNRRAFVGGFDPVRRDGDYGVRSGVRVGKG